MIKYAIVGNIASGKSTAEKIIEEFGYKVLDTDKVGHKLLDCSEIKEAFKDFDIFDKGRIFREKLGQLVFSNVELRKTLEDILHPMIKNRIEEFFVLNSNEKSVFVSVPLLFESGMASMFDKIIFIYADDDIRLKRLIARNGFSLEYAKKRLECQLSQDEKIKKSDIIIYNNSSVDDFKNAIISKLAL